MHSALKPSCPISPPNRSSPHFPSRSPAPKASPPSSVTTDRQPTPSTSNSLACTQSHFRPRRFCPSQLGPLQFSPATIWSICSPATAFPLKPKLRCQKVPKSRSRDPLASNQATVLGPLLLPSCKFRYQPYWTLPQNHYPPTSTPFTTITPWPTTGSLGPSPPPSPMVPCPTSLQRLSSDQRTSFLLLWDQLPLYLRDITFDLHGSGWSPSVIEELGHVSASLSTSSSHNKSILARAHLFRSRFQPPRTAPLCFPAPTESTLSSPSRPMLYLTNNCPQASFSTRPLRTPAPWSPFPRMMATPG